MPVVSYGTRSDVGRVREDNQDSTGVFPADFPGREEPTEVLFVVADGMGGHRGGKQASDIAVRIIGERFFSSNQATIPDRLHDAIDSANTAVRDYGAAHPDCRGMGTTITVLVFLADGGFVAHVGDSRAYRVTENKIEQLTEDHSIVAEWQRKGWITEEQAKSHPERSLLYRALGVSDDITVDITDIGEIRDGDSFLLCTDGLTNHVEETEIRDALSSRLPQDACDALVNMALERGGFDNVTVLAVRFGQKSDR